MGPRAGLDGCRKSICGDVASSATMERTEVLYKCPIFLPDFNNIWIFLIDFCNSTLYYISRKWV
jgi:hypothetical protein